jgi:formylglycine-generating enzyme required for sulfatase activity
LILGTRVTVAGKIFVNYRRDDSAAHALNVSQYLERAFGARNVFIDIDRMRAGQKFPEVLERRLAECKVMVTVIGPSWLNARDDNDRRRLDDPTDWVRLEIVRALARNITVIPVTVGGAELPKRSELPEELRPLLDYHAVAVTTNGFRSDMAGLLNDIRAIPRPSSWWPRFGAGLTAVVALAVGILGTIHLLGQAAPEMPPGSQVDPNEQPRQQDEAGREAQPEVRDAALTERTKLVDLMKQNPLERPPIAARLAALGYIPVATATAGERWLKAGGGKEAAERFRDCEASETWCPEMVAVPAGRFLMGSPKDELGRANDEDDSNGKRVGVVVAKPLAIGRFAVTRGEFAAFISEAGRKMEIGCEWWSGDSEWKFDDARSWRSPGFDQTDRHPVTCINWADAKAYVDWLSKRTGKSYRLPSEAEWEYVTRAETTTPYWWGSSISTDQANYGEYRRRTMPVDSFAANPWGLYQVHGNVWQWVEDCYHKTYNAMPSATKGGATPWVTGCDGNRVGRGGSWINYPKYLRSATRVGANPIVRNVGVGFRVARTL